MMEGRVSLEFRIVLLAAWAALCFLAFPIFVAAPVSLTPERFLSFPKGEISWGHYEAFLTSDRWLASIGRSALIGAISSAVAVIVGTTAAIGLWRISSRATEYLRAMILAPMIIPPIISALAFYRLWGQLGWLDSYFGVILAHSILAMPYVVITVSASLANLDMRLEQAARGMGASMWQTVTRVIIPNIKVGIASGAIFAFIVSWDEIVVTLFIARRAVITLPRMIWDGIRDNVDPTVAVCATLLVLITILVLSIQLILPNRKLPKSNG
ncbi:MAG: ABC transporter permease [Dongiaceae bacterium]